MLVLTRKPGEQIFIGDAIVITFVRFGKNSVRVGIDAPRNMVITRGELKEQTCDESDPTPLVTH